MGGLESILKRFRVEEIWFPNQVDDRWSKKLQTLAIAKGVHWRGVHRKVNAFRCEDLEISVLHPPQNWLPKSHSSNNRSLVLMVIAKNQKVLLMADAEIEAEKEIQKYKAQLQIDVLKLGHHGSRTSSSDAFLKQTRPTFKK